VPCLGRTTDFQGIVGFRPDTTPAVITDPELTKAAATQRLVSSFFLPRIPEPPLTTDHYTPEWRHTLIKRAASLPNPIFDSVTEPAARYQYPPKHPTPHAP